MMCFRKRERDEVFGKRLGGDDIVKLGSHGGGQGPQASPGTRSFSVRPAIGQSAAPPAQKSGAPYQCRTGKPRPPVQKSRSYQKARARGRYGTSIRSWESHISRAEFLQDALDLGLPVCLPSPQRCFTLLDAAWGALRSV